MKKSEDILANNLLQLLRDLMKYWYLIVISLAIAIPVALLYLKFSANTYRVTGSVLIRLENNNVAGRGGGDDIFRAFDIIRQDRTLQNEIYFMQSMPLIREVVEEMDIRTYYYMQEGFLPKNMTFTYNNIYRNAPFWVIPTEGHVQPVELHFHVQIIDEEVFHISASTDEAIIMDFSTERVAGYNQEVNISGVHNFGSIIESDNLSFVILLNSNYDPQRHLDKDFFFKFNNLNWLAGSFKSGLDVSSRIMESSLAELTVRAENQNLGLDFLNMLIDKYIEANNEEANLLANKTIEHIENQLANVTDELTSSEQQLQNLRSDQRLMDIPERAQIIHQQLEGFRNQREEAQRRLNYLEQLQSHFVEYSDSVAIPAPSAIGVADQNLNAMIQELTNLNAERQMLIRQDQRRNPRLLTIEIRIENYKNAISENLQFALNTARNDLSGLNRKIGDLNQEYASLPATQRQMLGIERRFNLNDALYTSLLERRIQAQIIKASKLPDAKVIEPPRVMGIASPNRIIVLFFALFLGIMIPSSGILGMKLIANRVTSKEDVQLLTKLPVIGSIPVNDSAYQNVVRESPRSPMAESFHILRTNLIYYMRGETNKTILITSSVPGEGKSFTAINIATSFAQTNSKTILIEFDLRNPNKFVNEVFNARDLVGISSYLINKATIDEIIVPTEVSNLDIILAGEIPPNPIELISTTKTRTLFEELKKKYDYIIIDTPPYSLVTDAFLLMEMADIKIHISRIGYTKKKVLESTLEDIEGKNVNNVHLVMNQSHEVNLKYGKYAYVEKSDKKGYAFSKSRKKIAVF